MPKIISPFIVLGAGGLRGSIINSRNETPRSPVDIIDDIHARQKIRLGCTAGNSSASLSLSWPVKMHGDAKRHQDGCMWNAAAQAGLHVTPRAGAAQQSSPQLLRCTTPGSGRTTRVRSVDLFLHGIVRMPCDAMYNESAPLAAIMVSNRDEAIWSSDASSTSCL